jgi:hypothetical protein
MKLRTQQYKLVVPSRERAAWLKGRTNHTLRYVAHMNPVLFVRDDDTQLDAYRWYANEYEVKLTLQSSKGVLGASQTYDFLIEQAIMEGYERLVVLDDDVNFVTFNPVLGAKPDFVRPTPSQLTQLMNLWVGLLCPEMPAVSMNSILRRTQPNLLSYSKALTWCYAYYLPHFVAHPEHRFAKGVEVEAHCDLNLSLQLLTQGYLTCLDNTLIMVTEPNNPGGCSTYRSEEVWQMSTRYLLAHYPQIVTPMPRRKSGGQAMRIAWKKAFNREAFAMNHGVRAEDFMYDRLVRFERDYGALVEEYRNEA